MMRSALVLAVSLSIGGVAIPAQVAQQSVRQDSVSVSANLSKKQLDLERQLNDLLAQAEKDRSRGDFAAALTGFEKALEKVRAETLLKEQEDRVLVKVGRTYIEARQPDDAVRSYGALLELRKNDCQPDAKEIERCAEAQEDVGFAQMNKGDFPAALPFLREAVASYGKAASGGSSEDYRMIKLKQQAEAQTLLAMALFRTGQRKDALGILDGATQQLDKVQGNEKIEASIRESARKSLKQREQILEAIKGN